MRYIGGKCLREYLILWLLPALVQFETGIDLKRSSSFTLRRVKMIGSGWDITLHIVVDK